MYNKITKNLLAVGCIAFTSAMLSAEQLLEVEDYTGFSLGTGIVADISCGNTNTVTLSGEKKVLEKIKVSVVNDQLSIERKSDASSFLGKLMSSDKSDGSVEAKVVTRGQISEIDASTGSVLSVEACAVNNSAMTIDASTGSTLNVAGSTSSLILELSTGSQFNAKTSGFSADTVELDLSTGAMANLCKSTTITGSASTGAVIYAGDATDVNDVSLSLGAETSSRRCQ